MPVSDGDISARAFLSEEWRSAADALLQATGATAGVMDFGSQVALSPFERCGCCPLSTEIEDPGPASCFGHAPQPGAGITRAVCCAGLIALIAPVERDGRTIGHAVLAGFVTSTRERRGLYERLVLRGLSEDSVRRYIKALPVISRREAESYLRMAVSNARTLVSATAERLAAAERVEELRLFVTAGRQVVSTEHLDASSLGAIAEEAVAIVGGVAGAVLRPRGGALEVVARCGQWRGPVGAVVPRDSTASGRAFENRKTIVAPGGSAGSATLAMPLMIGARPVGVLEARIAAAELPLPSDRLSRLNRFGQFVAIALEREDERRGVERAMAGYTQLNELASKLGGQTDTDGVTGVVTAAVARSLEFDLCGLVLNGWGRDRADVLMRSQASRQDVEHVLGIVSGRDPSTDPFRELRYLPSGLSPGEDGHADDWALAACEVAYGDLTVGWLFVARSDGERYGAQDQALLRGIAAHAGSALGRAALFARIRDDYAKTIAALSASLEHGERAPAGRSARVMEHAMMIGEELGLDFESIEQLRLAGLIHDIGKTGVPEEILLKPSVLTAEEMAAVRRHAEIGASIVEQIELLKSLTPVVLHHHENWDGSGYPEGLAGEQIPLLSRVLAVADAYEALTSGRLTGRKLTVGQARKRLREQSGTLYDPSVVSALFAVFDRMALAAGTGLLVADSAKARVDLPA